MNEYGLGPGVFWVLTSDIPGADERLSSQYDWPWNRSHLCSSESWSIRTMEVLCKKSYWVIAGGIWTCREYLPKSKKVRRWRRKSGRFIAGIYRIPETWRSGISVSKNGLEINAEFSEEPGIYLYQKDDSTFLQHGWREGSLISG